MKNSALVRWWTGYPPFIAPTVDVEIEYVRGAFGFSFVKADPWFVTTA